MAINNDVTKCNDKDKIKVDCNECGTFVGTTGSNATHICAPIGATTSGNFNLSVAIPISGGTKVIKYSDDGTAASCTADTGAPAGADKANWDKI